MFLSDIYYNYEYRDDDKDVHGRQELASFSDDLEEYHLMKNYNLHLSVYWSWKGQWASEI
jgi:hypothetical protein